VSVTFGGVPSSDKMKPVPSGERTLSTEGRQMRERDGYDRVYHRVLGIGLLVSVAVFGATVAWDRQNAGAADVGEDAQAGAQLALAYADAQPAELADVRVTEADEVAASLPAPDAATSTEAAALDLEPPKLSMASSGSLISVSLVDAPDDQIESAIEYDRLGAAVAAAANGAGDANTWERVGGFRIPEGSGRRGPLIIGGGGGGCQGPRTVRLPGTRIGGFSGIGVGTPGRRL